MSQNDLVIANQTFPATRADITSALQALGSTNSGPSAPSTTYANMMWYDTTSNILKIRAEANDAWINIGYLDQSLDTFKILDDTVVTTAAGVDTDGIIGDQSTATWEAGTGTTESLVSPAKVKASVLANQADDAIGVGQSWRADTSRLADTWYYNNSIKAIMIQAYYINGATVYVGPTTSNFATILQSDRDGDLDNPSYVIIPAGHYWKVSHVDHTSSSNYQNILD